jgi:hypothetical protein
MFTAIDRTLSVLHSTLYKTSLIRTILYINNLPKDKIDENVANEVKHHVYAADIYDDLGRIDLSVSNLKSAKEIIKNHIHVKGLIVNRVNSSRDIGDFNKISLDCQLLIISFIK